MTPVQPRKKIIYKSEREIQLMHEAGKIVHEVLTTLSSLVREGTTTAQLDKHAVKIAEKYKAQLAFFGYRGFPAHICTSINEEVVHGIPGSRMLKNGDILSVDVGICLKEYYADAAVTLPVGDISPLSERLISVCRQSLDIAIRAALPGSPLSAVSKSVQNFVESNGFSVVRQFVGHGIGRSLHEDPQVPNFVSTGKFSIDVALKPGITIAIEPMVNAGVSEVEILPNKWTVVTRDGKPSAHFEHTVAVTEKGPVVLTLP